MLDAQVTAAAFTLTCVCNAGVHTHLHDAASVVLGCGNTCNIV